MSLGEIGARLLRQWLVVLVGLALTLGAGFAALQTVPFTYRATAHMLLLPGESTIPEAGNPFLHLGGLYAMRDVLARAMVTDEVEAEILEGTTDTGYEVLADTSSAAPNLVTVVEGPSPAEALGTLDDVVSAAPGMLQTVQEDQGVTTSAQVTLMLLSSDRQAEQVQSSTVRAVIAVLLLGGVLTLLAGVWIDTLREERRSAREGRRPARESLESRDSVSAPSTEQASPHAATASRD